MQGRADNNKHFASCSFKQHLLLIWSAYVKRSVKNPRACFNKHCLQTTDHMLQGCQMRTKNNVHSNSIISNIYIMDEILLFGFQIAHLARLLTGRRQYMLVYRLRKLGAFEQLFDTWCLFSSYWLAGAPSEMTYIVSSGALNSTHSPPPSRLSQRRQVGRRIGLKSTAPVKRNIKD